MTRQANSISASSCHRPEGIPANYYGASFRWAWAYQNIQSEVLGYVCRFDGPNGKETIPFFKRNNDEWTTGGPDAPKPLFGLPSIDGKTHVYVTEGEKCAVALHGLGLPAVTSIGGAANAGKADWEPLRGLLVTLLPDNDTSGESYARDVTGILHRLECGISVCHFPGLPDKGDVVDWIQANGGEASSWDGFAPLNTVMDRSLAIMKAGVLKIIEENTAPVPAEWLSAPEPKAKASKSKVASAMKGSREILPLRRNTVPRVKYPIDALPEVMRDAVKALHEAVKAPICLCGQSILTAANLAAQGLADVHIDGRMIPLHMYLATVGKSGERKTGADRQAMKAVEWFQNELDEMNELDMRRYGAEKAAFEKLKKNINGKASKTQSKEALRKAYEDLGPEPLLPPKPKILHGNATWEGVAANFRYGRASQAWATSEGAIFTSGYSLKSDTALSVVGELSRVWDDGVIERTRGKDAEATHLPGKRLCLHMLMQPGVARDFFTRPEFRDQGVLSRFLLAWPESAVGTRMYEAVDIGQDPRMHRFWGVTMALLQRTPAMMAPIELCLEPEAIRAWIALHDDYERRAGVEGDLEAVQPLALKSAEHVLRIAGNFAIVEDADSIHHRHIEGAGRLMAFYLAEGLRLVSEADRDTELIVAEELDLWLKGKKLESVTTVYIYRNGPLQFRSVSAAREAMLTLAEHGIWSLDTQLKDTKLPETWKRKS